MRGGHSGSILWLDVAGAQAKSMQQAGRFATIDPLSPLDKRAADPPLIHAPQ